MGVVSDRDGLSVRDGACVGVKVAVGVGVGKRILVVYGVGIAVAVGRTLESP